MKIIKKAIGPIDNPKLRQFLSRLKNVQAVDDLNSKPIEWNELQPRERRIAVHFFWQGFLCAQTWRQMEEAWRRGEIE